MPRQEGKWGLVFIQKTISNEIKLFHSALFERKHYQTCGWILNFDIARKNRKQWALSFRAALARLRQIGSRIHEGNNILHNGSIHLWHAPQVPRFYTGTMDLMCLFVLSLLDKPIDSIYTSLYLRSCKAWHTIGKVRCFSGQGYDVKQYNILLINIPYCQPLFMLMG